MKKSIVFLFVTAMVCCLMAGCSNKNHAKEEAGDGISENPQANLRFDIQTMPRIDGSTLMVPYYEELVARLLDLPVEEARKYVVCNKTHRAYVGLITGQKDIIFCTPPSKEELELAKSNNVELEATPILSDGFVFFVNAENPVDSLTMEQVQDIYRGKITNWKEVGGADTPIAAYQRPDNSGSQTGMYKYILPEKEIMSAPEEKIIAGMGGIIDAVASYNNEEEAIGYSYYYYVADMYGAENIKLLAIDGIKPNNKTIAEGEYPVATKDYAVIRKSEPKDSNVRKVIEWILSEEGQALGEETGYVRKSSK